ncbi:unnamed protein product [Strongylus vulgaris]|uniref:Uncharacterized protein n=1 Tax=Strongylus vulgaris TaxID=40348 RepID=A0A3P7KAK9_STRVU|nr:unnamed protein product [Strongylus vulgaris]
MGGETPTTECSTSSASGHSCNPVPDERDEGGTSLKINLSEL